MPLDRNSQAFLICLTIGIFGLQSTLAVQTSRGSPFLLSLGLQKPLISLIWTGGPIAGALAQPYFGVLSDRSRSSWGRRRPFIVRGAALMGPSLVLLAWVRELSQGLGWMFGLASDSMWQDVILKLLAVANIWTYFFGFQMAQLGFRALMVDCCPPHLLDQAMVWATRWNCLGNILAYGAGYLDLPSILPLPGASEFKILALFAAIIITVAAAIVCWVVEEQRNLECKEHAPGFVAVFRQAVHNVSRLPPNIWTIFEVQFCAWAGWFLFNYYITTYLGALRKREETQGMPQVLLDESATRYGSFALLLSAMTTLATTVLGPFLIAHTSRTRSCLPRFTLRDLWFVAQAVFAVSMLSTFMPITFLHTSTGVAVLVALAGMPWALTTWAPFSLIGQELSILNADNDEVSHDSVDGLDLDEKRADDEVIKGSGTVMSLYIAAISVPQLVATLSSSVIFGLSDGSEVSTRGLEWVLKLSGMAAAVAAWRIWWVVDRARQ
ncbi:hypothetical protein LTR85_001027 [Meristemomyces frigidus]|nr:hypothetical protein LTR85_001027 [Meristemomyces frigidus]